MCLCVEKNPHESVDKTFVNYVPLWCMKIRRANNGKKLKIQRVYLICIIFPKVVLLPIH
jgi:hypothetical protein